MRILIAIFFIFMVACSSSPNAPRITEVKNPFENNKQNTSNQNSKTNFPLNNSDSSFKQALLKINIDISQNEIETLKKYNDFLPSNKWLESNSIDEKNVLINNFNNLASTFKGIKFKNYNEYKERALYFSNSKNLYAKLYFDSLYYKNKNKLLVCKWDTQTNEFLLIYLDGSISNYQINENLSKTRYIEIPQNIGN
ncbi:MAG: hypothetical protein U0457_02685 [Candidatus Sericytochromatia bacterium]